MEMTREVSHFDMLMQTMPSVGAVRDEAVAALQLDHKGRIVDATVDAASMLGYAPDALHSRTLGDLAADQWRELADGATARILCGDTNPFQLMLRGVSGRRTLVQMVSRRVERDGETNYVLAWSVQFLPFQAESTRTDAPELRRLAYGLLHSHETERSRVAADLHSSVAPLVVMVKFMVEEAIQCVTRGAHTQGVEMLGGVTGRLRDVLNEVRRISMQLRPSLLDDLGLLPTIEWFCRTFEESFSTIKIERRIAVSEIELPEHLKLDIFRIIQEALTNVAEHAHASHARVALVRETDELKLWVEDDGVGFDVGRHVDRDCSLGVGLPSIRKRVEATNGRLVFDSRPKGGSVIGAIWTLPPRSTLFHGTP